MTNSVTEKELARMQNAKEQPGQPKPTLTLTLKVQDAPKDQMMPAFTSETTSAAETGNAHPWENASIHYDDHTRINNCIFK